MADPFVGEIRMFAGSFAPNGWAFCGGQLMAISQNTALFSLLGTYYGGDGKSTFALPDLRDRVPIHQGQGPGLTQRNLGEQGGSPTVTLSGAELPTHAHPVSTAAATTNQAAGGVPAAGGHYVGVGTPGNAPLPHDNRSPYLGLSFIIALQGVFPPRS